MRSFVDIYKKSGGKISGKDLDLLRLPGWQLFKGRKTTYAKRVETKGGVTRREYLHRLIAERIYKRDLTRRELVDHIDGNGLNNNRSNLRICRNSENLRNRVSLSKNNKSGIAGVYFCRQTEKWSAEIMIDRKKIWLGRFFYKQNAVKARRIAEKKYWGAFAPKERQHEKGN